jgi:hypothetical protein
MCKLKIKMKKLRFKSSMTNQMITINNSENSHFNKKNCANNSITIIIL